MGNNNSDKSNLTDQFEGDASLADGGIAFILPSYNAFSYSHRAASSFFEKTPVELNPVLIHCDDCSPQYDRQNWDFFYSSMPLDRVWHKHFIRNAGLTRSWNYGLRVARALKCKYAISGNSDVVFSEGWYKGLIHQLENGLDLVGPITNAPGRTSTARFQDIHTYIKTYDVSDDPERIDATARQLLAMNSLETMVSRNINGFFMMAKVDTWWQGAFDEQNVFNPAFPMVGNEDELETRWCRNKMKIGISPVSFMFHYRSVTRGRDFITSGAARMRRGTADA